MATCGMHSECKHAYAYVVYMWLYLMLYAHDFLQEFHRKKYWSRSEKHVSHQSNKAERAN